MLLLTRKVGETIKIGHDIDVQVYGVNGNQVKVGVKAPDNIEVHRSEIYEKIMEGQYGDERKRDFQRKL